MSLLNKASLIQIPSGYKDGTLYSAKPTNGDGDFTFSRGSNLAATRVNSEGLIEKGRENLLLQSNSFDTTWSTTNTTLTSGQSGYDGSTDAWKVEATNGVHRVEQNVNFSGVNTISVYAKKGNATLLRMQTQTGGTDVFFDLNNGTIDFQEAAAVDAQIEAVGTTGWYRCSMTINESGTNIRFLVQSSRYSVSDGDYLYIQDAQLEQGLVATDYIETTTTTAQAGILEDMPRLDYSGGASCPSLLLEPQRSNLVDDYSGYTWDEFNGASIAFNGNQQSPEGLDNAVTWTFSGTSGEVVQRSSITISNSTTYTISGYFKLTSGTLTSGSNQLKGLDGLSGANVSLNTLTSEWQRLSFNVTSSSTTGRVQFRCDDSATIQVYGLQLEAGGYETSIIPTYGSSVTRSQDVCKITGANATAIIDKSAMTLYAEAELVDNSATTILAILRDATGGFYDDFISLTFTNSLEVRFEVREGAGPQGTITSSTLSEGTHKIAAVLTSTSMKLFVDGALSASTTITATPNDLDEIYLAGYPDTNNRFGSKKQFLFFPTALTDDELASLTTI